MIKKISKDIKTLRRFCDALQFTMIISPAAFRQKALIGFLPAAYHGGSAGVAQRLVAIF
jgi:hypothetical protein